MAVPVIIIVSFFLVVPFGAYEVHYFDAPFLLTLIICSLYFSIKNDNKDEKKKNNAPFVLFHFMFGF